MLDDCVVPFDFIFFSSVWNGVTGSGEDNRCCYCCYFPLVLSVDGLVTVVGVRRDSVALLVPVFYLWGVFR